MHQIKYFLKKKKFERKKKREYINLKAHEEIRAMFVRESIFCKKPSWLPRWRRAPQGSLAADRTPRPVSRRGYSSSSAKDCLLAHLQLPHFISGGKGFNGVSQSRFELTRPKTRRCQKKTLSSIRSCSDSDVFLLDL